MVFKMDIFKRLVYLLNLDEPGSSPVPVAVEDVKELLEMNARGDAPVSIAELAIEEEPDEMEEVYADVVGQDSLTRFDEARRKKRKRGGRDRDRDRNRPAAPASGTGGGAAPKPQPAPPGPEAPRGPRPEASEGSGESAGSNRSRRNRGRGRDRRKSGNETPRPDAG